MRRPSTPPEAMSEANAEWCADLNKENRELRATITRLTLKRADDDAVKARDSGAPEEMIALPTALGVCPAKHDWAVKQIKLQKVVGEQRGGRWWVVLSSLQKATKSVFG
jgi:hypothetical protein